LHLEQGMLGLALLELLHVDLHAQPTEAERDLHVRRPVGVVVHVEALDAGHRLRHRRWIVQDLPDRRARRGERALALEVHASTTPTCERVLSGCWSISQTRLYGFQLSTTIALPLPRSASCSAAHTAWMLAPPPSPMPFVPSGVKGDALSM